VTPEASLLARTFASPCLSRKPKARVATLMKLTFKIIIFYARGVEKQLPNGTLAKFCQNKIK
jgi:hypothetical protein